MFSVINGSYNPCINHQHLPHRPGHNSRYIRRHNQNAFTFSRKLTNSQNHRIKHLRCLIAFVFYKPNARMQKMFFQFRGTVSGHNNNRFHSQLLKHRHNMYRDRRIPKRKHGFQFLHPRRLPCGSQNCPGLLHVPTSVICQSCFIIVNIFVINKCCLIFIFLYIPF